MSLDRRCPQCGSVLAADAPEGLCPACLLKQAATIPPSDLAGGSSGSGTPVTPGGSATTSPYRRFQAPSPAELAPLFPQLEIIELLGQGGMGAVYKARQPGLDRLVALKVLPREIGGDASFAERFTREARALARLNHPNIVSVFDFGQTAPPAILPGRQDLPAGAGGEGGLFYFVMEYVDGLDLRRMLRSGQMTPREVLAIVPQMCEALQFAHDEGVVHRDIKPENVLVDKRGRVKVADFGLAKLLAKSDLDFTLTGSQQVMGTFHYMAPEQMERPQEVDHRADIYALGVVFYEMLTGQLPLGRFAAPSQKVQVDVRLDEVVFRALEREPERRYQHASDVKTDVETIVRDPRRPAPTPAAAPSPPPADADLEAARRQVQVPAIALMVLGIIQCVAWVPFAAALAIFGAMSVGHAAHPLEYSRPLASALPAAMIFGVGPAELFVLFLLMIPVGFMMCLGGWKMRRLESAGLVMLGAIAALIPCGPWWVFSLPVGIWALVVLNKPDIKAAFERQARQSPTPAATRSPLAGQEALDYARRRVQGPAIGLIVVACLLLLAALLAGAFLVVGAVNDGGAAGWTNQPTEMLWLTLAAALLEILAAALLIVIGIKLRQVQWYGLALAVAIGIVASVLVCLPGVLALPIGVWAIVVLANRDVRTGFAYQARGAEKPAATGGPDQTAHAELSAADWEAAARQVRAPGMGLIVVGVLSLMPCILGVPLAAAVFPTFRSGGETRPEPRSDDSTQFGTTVELCGPKIEVEPCGCGLSARTVAAAALGLGPAATWALIQMADPARAYSLFAALAAVALFLSLPIGGVLILGGIKMRAMELHGLSVTASALAMLPCGPAWLVGLPVGLWALMVLLKPEVKAAFRHKPAQPPTADPDAAIDQAAPAARVRWVPAALVSGLLALLVVAVAAAVHYWPWVFHEPIRTVMVYEFDQGVPGDTIVSAIERRLIADGKPLGEARLVGQNQIEVSVYGGGLDAADRVEARLAALGTLEFRIVANRRDHPLRIDQAVAVEGTELTNAGGEVLARWVPIKDDPETIEWLVTDTSFATRTRADATEVLVVIDQWNVTGNFLQRADAAIDERGMPCIEFTLNTQGAARFGGLTSENLPDPATGTQRSLGIILNGKLLSAPRLMSVISSHSQITGNFTEREVEDLVDVLNAGTLPCPLRQRSRFVVD